MMRGLRLVAGLLLLATTAFAQPSAEDCGGGITRWWPGGAVREAAPPYPGLVTPLRARGEGDSRVEPVFQRIHGRHAVRVSIEEGTDLYGTGEVAGPLRRNGWRATAWNFDAYGYVPGTLHLYQSHPWVLAVRADGTSFGVLALTPERVHIDLTRDILMVADGPAYGVLILEGATPREVVARLTQISGRMPLPPRWALGYHQCRYSYTPDDRVREVAGEFRARGIPCDVIWLDIDYMDGFRCFTFHPTDFADPAALMADLHAEGFRVITILDPGIKLDEGYEVYRSGRERDVWVRSADGEPWVGDVWPGPCVFPDFTGREARDWWADQVVDFVSVGIDGLWNDMNEPAIFHVGSKTMPLDNRHEADGELGGPGDHARYHNLYGMQMARASWEGLKRARPERRPFVLTRANHLGGQRWAATWTGDNLATWQHLDISIPMALNLGLSGQPFAGPDIGGFGGAGDGRMFARWMGIGALLPFARGHTGKGNIDKEPWAFGPEVEATCRRALLRRMRLLPYLYTLFYLQERDGLPPMRPLFFADPADPGLRDQDDAFLLGDDLLVVCFPGADGGGGTTMPSGDWRLIDLDVDDADDPDLPRLYLRAGAVLPLGPAIQHGGEWEDGAIQLLVAPDADGNASGWLYEDAGDGDGYRDGEYRLTRLEIRARADGVGGLRTERVAGDWPALELTLEDDTVRRIR